MKQQTGLQKLSKEFFYQLSISEIHNKESFEDYYQRVEEKWFNVQKFNDESSIPHTDTKIWEQLYFSVCQELVQLRKIYYEDFKHQAKMERLKCGCQSSKGFNPDLPDNCGECPNIRIEWIICPDCSMNQEAEVIPTIPFETRIHECEQCGYLITESEWIIDSDE